MRALHRGDAVRLLDVAAELAQIPDPAVLPGVAVELAARLVPGERACLVTFDPRTGHMDRVHWPDPVVGVHDVEPPPDVRLPLVGELVSAQAQRLRISDLMSRRQWHEHPAYQWYGPAGVEFQCAVRLPLPGPAVRGLSINRPDRDFTEREVAMVMGIGRQVAALMTRSQPGGAHADGLTQMQRAVLDALADGATVRQAAARLGIAEKTADNHLQAAYRRLGVSNRVAALRMLRL